MNHAFTIKIDLKFGFSPILDLDPRNLFYGKIKAQSESIAKTLPFRVSFFKWCYPC